ncbi:glycosyltransferase [Paenibacillus polygoni]|uniref:Glycosyltransferase n=1 Tax=Paenibacillus polygoni TaxID=3050112 RepID=A0ABY8WZ98_9BACL|nr:glycosyltransferase [Paenibacillus polygoni]WIV18540.1 glycosyltransferase [Paenibacillus polygoni]
MTQKPKLMLFSHISHSQSITGAEKLLLRFCQEMRPYFRCVLVVPNEGMISLLARKNGIRVKVQSYELLHNIYTPHEGLRQEADQLMHTPSSHAVIRLLQKESPQIVLTNTCVNAVPAMAARMLYIPVIWKITETITMNAYTGESIKIIDEFSNWVIGISQTVFEPLQGSNISAKSTILSPTWDASLAAIHQWNVLRATRRSMIGLSPEHFCVGYISTFIYDAKGLLPFVQSALSLCESYPHSRFWIIGNPVDEVYYNECVRLIAESRYRQQFIFTPFLEQVSEAYCAMDLTAVPSMVKEGFGMTALESLYFGTPVVAFGQGGLQEMMEAVGNSHLLAEPGSASDLASRMAVCIQNPEETARTGERSKIAAEQRYGAEAYKNRAEDMIRQLMSQFPDWFGTPSARLRTHAKKRKPVKSKRRIMQQRKKKSSSARLKKNGKKSRNNTKIKPLKKNKRKQTRSVMKPQRSQKKRKLTS